MDSLVCVLADLSHPQAAKMAKLVLRARWRRALSKLRALQIAQGGQQAICRMIDECLVRDLFSVAHPILTCLEFNLGKGAALPNEVLLNFAILATLLGAKAEWSITLEKKINLICDEYTFFEVISGCSTATNEENVLVFFRFSGAISRFSIGAKSSGEQDILKDGLAFKAPTIMLGGVKAIIASEKFLPEDILEMSKSSDFVVSSDGGSQCSINKLNSSAKVLGESASSFVPAVSIALSHIGILYDTSGHRIMSVSSARHLGVAALTVDCNPYLTGELLVHEASHQFFNILSWTSRIETVDDREVVYSALAGRMRPASRALLAYHALVNIVLYYEGCLKFDSASGCMCDSRLDLAYDGIAKMDSSFSSANNLSRQTTELWEALRDVL
jgi:hypothetical protein